MVSSIILCNNHQYWFSPVQGTRSISHENKLRIVPKSYREVNDFSQISPPPSFLLLLLFTFYLLGMLTVQDLERPVMSFLLCENVHKEISNIHYFIWILSDRSYSGSWEFGPIQQEFLQCVVSQVSKPNMAICYPWHTCWNIWGRLVCLFVCFFFFFFFIFF